MHVYACERVYRRTAQALICPAYHKYSSIKTSPSSYSPSIAGTAAGAATPPKAARRRPLPLEWSRSSQQLICGATQIQRKHVCLCCAHYSVCFLNLFAIRVSGCIHRYDCVRWHSEYAAGSSDARCVQTAETTQTQAQLLARSCLFQSLSAVLSYAVHSPLNP